MPICLDCNKPTFRHGAAYRCRDCAKRRERRRVKAAQIAKIKRAAQAQQDRIERAGQVERLKLIKEKRARIAAKKARLATSRRHKRERERIAAKRAADPSYCERERDMVRERMRVLRAAPGYVRPDRQSELRHR